MKRFTVTVGDSDTITNIKTEIDLGDGWEECIAPENSPKKCLFPGTDYTTFLSSFKRLIFKIERW